MSTNPYILFNLPHTYQLDPSTLEAAYFAQLRQHHPDRWQQQSSEAQAAAAEQAVTINEAYTHAKHPVKRGQALLQILGQDEQLPEVPPAVLMEIMDWQELSLQNASAAQERYQTKKTQLEQAISRAFDYKQYREAQSLLTEFHYWLRAPVHGSSPKS